jgi:hypothetical protein
MSISPLLTVYLPIWKIHFRHFHHQTASSRHNILPHISTETSIHPADRDISPPPVSLTTSTSRHPPRKMAALIILAGAMIHDRITEKTEVKRRKNLETERKYRQLQAETDRRAEKAAVERNYDSEDEKEDEPLPRYEDIAGSGEGSSAAAASSASRNPRVEGDAPPPGYGSSELRGNPGV